MPAENRAYARNGRRLADQRHRRRGVGPAGSCQECWQQRIADHEPGELYTWLDPSKYALTALQQASRRLCEACVEEERRRGNRCAPIPALPAPAPGVVAFTVRTTPDTSWEVVRQYGEGREEVVFDGYGEYQAHCVAQALLHYFLHDRPAGPMLERYEAHLPPMVLRTQRVDNEPAPVRTNGYAKLELVR